MNRKDFFKSLGLGIGASLMNPVNEALAMDKPDASLTQEQKEFLTEYQNWLSEFGNFVNERSSNGTEFTNNTKLMQLADEAKSRKQQLEKHMEDENFARYFHKVSESIQQNIE